MAPRRFCSRNSVTLPIPILKDSLRPRHRRRNGPQFRSVQQRGGGGGVSRDARVTHHDGALPGVEILLTVLSTADRDGLRPQDYHLTQLEARFQEVRQTQTSQTPWALHRLIDLELLCTEAFLQYGSHAMSGRLHPEQVEQAWYLERDADAID